MHHTPRVFLLVLFVLLSLPSFLVQVTLNASFWNPMFEKGHWIEDWRNWYLVSFFWTSLCRQQTISYKLFGGYSSQFFYKPLKWIVVYTWFDLLTFHWCLLVRIAFRRHLAPFAWSICPNENQLAKTVNLKDIIKHFASIKAIGEFLLNDNLCTHCLFIIILIVDLTQETTPTN